MSKTSSEGTRGKKDLLSKYLENNPEIKINTMNFRPGMKEIEAIKAKIADVHILEDAEQVIVIPLKDNMKDYDKISIENTKINSESIKKASKASGKSKEDEATK